MTEVKETAKSKIADIENEASRMIQEAFASADAAVASEAEKHRETSRKLAEAIEAAKEKENKLSSSIAELTTYGSSLQN